MNENKFIIKNGVLVESASPETTVFEIEGTNRLLMSINDTITGDTFTVSNITGGTALGIDSEGDISIERRITAAQFIKSGGTSAQFLKADGTVDSSSYSQVGHTHPYLSDTGGTVSGNLYVAGDLVVTGSTYQTHTNEIFTKSDFITLREGAVSGLANGAYTGIEAIKYDGVNNGRLVFDNQGWARVGDSGNEQIIATRITNPGDTQIAIWDATNLRLNFISQSTFAPASGSPNYIQLSPTNTQTGNIKINGTINWGSGAGTGVDASGLWIEQVGTNTSNENIRLQTSKSGDLTNYVSLVLDPTSGFQFNVNGTGNGLATFPSTISSTGFIKNGSSSAYLLTGDGGHVATSTFALASSLSNYWDKSGAWISAALTSLGATRVIGITGEGGSSEFGLATLAGQMYPYADGFFYQNEGQYRVLDTSNIGVTVAAYSHSHDDRYYTETEIGNLFSGGVTISGYNKSNWDTAFSWGNHLGLYFPRRGIVARVDANTAPDGIVTEYRFDNTPLDTISTLKTVIYSPDWIAQEFTSMVSDRKWLRRRYSGTTWSAWQEFIHTGNYSSYALPLSGGMMSGSEPYIAFGSSWNTGIFHIKNYTTDIVNISASLADFRMGGSFQGNLIVQKASGDAYTKYISNTTETYVGTDANGFFITSGGVLRYYIQGGVHQLAGNGFTYNGYEVIHSGNIGSQSVSYATSAGNADTLDNIDSGYFVQGTSGLRATSAVGLNADDMWRAGFYTAYNTTNFINNADGGFLTIPTWSGSNASSKYAIQIGSNINGSIVYRHLDNNVAGSWRTVWDNANLTNTLSNGYLSYWNGSSLGDTILWFGSSNVYIGSKRADDGIGLISQNYSMGYTYSTKFITLQSATEQYGITNDYGVGTGAQLSIVANQTSGNIGFYTGGAKGDKNERMRILPNGDVVIGETYSPTISDSTSKLDIYQGSVEKWLSISGTGDAPKSIGWIDRTNSRAWIWSHRTDNSFNSYYYNGSSWLLSMSLATNGNVGIGTSNPEFSDWSSSSKGLVIDATSAGYSILKLVGTSTAKLILTAGSGANYLWCYGANPFAIAVNNVERFRISSNGNIGLGYTDRSEKFAVNGSGYFNSDLIVNGQGSFNNVNVATSTGITLREAGYGYWNIRTTYEWSNPDLIFSANGTRRFRVSAAGNFDIGYTDGFNNNVYTLNVNGSGYFNDDLKVGVSKRIGWEYGDGNMYNWITNSYSANGGIQYRSGGWTGGNILAHNFQTWNGSNWVTALEIWQDKSAYFSSSVTASAFYHSSDVTLKNIISPLESSLDKLRNMSTFYYTLKNDSSQRIQLGMSAQEFDDKFPTLVGKDSNDKLQLEYARIAVLAVKAIQELDILQQEQKKKIIDLENEINELKQKIYGTSN